MGKESDANVTKRNDACLFTAAFIIKYISHI